MADRYRTTAMLLSAATANNSAPATGGAGIDLEDFRQAGSGKIPEWMTIAIRGTRTSGTATAIFRLWFKYSATWAPAGNGTDADKGKLNEGTAVSEVTANEMRHAQLVRVPEHATRAYLEILSIGGTGTSIDAEMIASKK